MVFLDGKYMSGGISHGDYCPVGIYPGGICPDTVGDVYVVCDLCVHSVVVW